MRLRACMHGDATAAPVDMSEILCSALTPALTPDRAAVRLSLCHSLPQQQCCSRAPTGARQREAAERGTVAQVRDEIGECD